jgi:tRNA modification GTPase
METTITALATPPGISGLAVIRVSGPRAFDITDKIFRGKRKIADSESHSILYGKIERAGEIIDTVTASIFRAPNSYTGENTVEIGCHGGNIIADMIISALLESGAEPAGPGEFTRRAFLNGKMDLAKVEAVADIIHSNSVAGAQTAARQLAGSLTKKLDDLRTKLLDISGLLELELDFSEEDLELIDKELIKTRINETLDFCNELAGSLKSAEILRSGYFVGIAGHPNSGKSTLFNSMLGRERAIVSDIEGTTRDYLEESIFYKGITIKITDTAGLRDTEDVIEIAGIKFVESVLEQSNMILILNDLARGAAFSEPIYRRMKEKYSGAEIIYVNNKSDISPETPEGFLISAGTGEGVSELKDYIFARALQSRDRVSDVLVNRRQASLLSEAAGYLQTALEGLEAEFENEIIAIDIRKATKILGEITGQSWNEEVLAHIFGQFCIGK